MRYLIFSIAFLASFPLFAQDEQIKGIEIGGLMIRVDNLIGKIITIKVHDQVRHYRISGYLPVEVTAYTRHRGQTDSSPCIPAVGSPYPGAPAFDLCKHNREDVIAINGLDFWTKVLIDTDGDGYLELKTVVDRMNPRFDEDSNPLRRHVDLWMRYLEDAIAYGRQFRTMFFLERVRPESRASLARH